MLSPFAHPVACCCAKFETGQTFQSTTPNISFVPWSPKRSATMLDPFAQLFQHFWGHARSLRMDYKDLWVIFFPRCTAGPKLVGSCYIRLHTTANTHATTMLGVVAPVRLHAALTCFKLWQTTRNNIHQGVQTNATCNIQQCWELLAFSVTSVCK